MTKKTTFGGRDIYYTLWRDKKPVRILHSIETYRGECRRQVKNTTTNQWGRQQYARPTIIPKYNGSMGGTDTNYQLGQTYRPRLKTTSCIPRVFSHFLNHAVVNMFVIALSIRNRMEQHEHVIKILPRCHLHFRLTLVDALTKSYLRQRILKEAPVNQQPMNKKQLEADLSRLAGAHHPTHLHTNDNQRLEGKKRPRNEGRSNARNWIRGYCKICNKLIPSFCESCQVHLCLGNVTNTLTCWKRFHTCRKITDPKPPADQEQINDADGEDDNSECFL